MKLFASFILAGLLSASMLAHAQPLTVAWKTIRPPEMDTLRYLEVQFAGDKFTLVPPNGCGIKTDLPSATIQLSASTGSVSMTIQFSTNSSRAILASKDAMQQYAAPQEANTEVREEFPAYSSTTPCSGHRTQVQTTRPMAVAARGRRPILGRIRRFHRDFDNS